MNTSLKTLQLKARHQVYTLLSGHNLSKLHGEGYDFSQLREYQIGDDIRKINWTITAKLSKPYIKELHANRELSIVVCALMDGSLYFGSKNNTIVNRKQEKLTDIATTLAYATQLGADLFTGLAYTQKQIFSTPPTKQQHHIEDFSKTIFETNVLHSSLELQSAFSDLFQRLYKPSLLFILGDFLEEVDLSILAQKHEVVVIIIRDIHEESPEKLGEVTLLNPKNSLMKETYFSKQSIKQYTAKLQENDEKNASHFSKYDIRSIKITTQDEVVSKLLTLFI